MVGARPDAELLDDRVHDVIGRDRTREALEDPREALGLGPPAGFERLDRETVADRGEADDDEQADHQPAGARRLEPDAEDRQQPQDAKRPDEREPGAADPPILRTAASPWLVG